MAHSVLGIVHNDKLNLILEQFYKLDKFETIAKGNAVASLFVFTALSKKFGE